MHPPLFLDFFVWDWLGGESPVGLLYFRLEIVSLLAASLLFDFDMDPILNDEHQDEEQHTKTVTSLSGYRYVTVKQFFHAITKKTQGKQSVDERA